MPKALSRTNFVMNSVCRSTLKLAIYFLIPEKYVSKGTSKQDVPLVLASRHKSIVIK